MSKHMLRWTFAIAGIKMPGMRTNEKNTKALFAIAAQGIPVTMTGYCPRSGANYVLMLLGTQAQGYKIKASGKVVPVIDWTETSRQTDRWEGGAMYALRAKHKSCKCFNEIA